MSKKKLVDYYYDKLLQYRNSFFYLIRPVAALSSKKYSIKQVLENVINAHNEYLLTDGLLYYLVVTSLTHSKPFSQLLFSKIDNISKDKVSVMNELFYYMDAYHMYQIKRVYDVNYVLGNKVHDVKSMANDIEGELNQLYDYDMIRVEQAYDLEPADYKFVKIVLNVILCYSLYSQDVDIYKELSKPYVHNPQEKLDELKMNGLYKAIPHHRLDSHIVDYQLNQVIDYVTNTPQSKNKLLIK